MQYLGLVSINMYLLVSCVLYEIPVLNNLHYLLYTYIVCIQ